MWWPVTKDVIEPDWTHPGFLLLLQTSRDLVSDQNNDVANA